MGKLLKLKIDVSKIDKTKLYKGSKGNYLDLDVWINEDEEQDWKKVSVNQSLSKEERDAKAQKVFCGSGELKFGWDETPKSQPSASSTPVDDGLPPF
jgi:hypothetical protein